MDFTELNRAIDSLEQEAESAAYRGKGWQEVWGSIKSIGAVFKQTRYPTKDEKDAARARFQEIVDRVKSYQANAQQERAGRAEVSERHKYAIIALAESGHPGRDLITAFFENVVSATTLGALQNDYQYELEQWSKKLKEAWQRFTEYKDEILGRDNQEIFQ